MGFYKGPILFLALTLPNAYPDQFCDSDHILLKSHVFEAFKMGCNISVGQNSPEILQFKLEWLGRQSYENVNYFQFYFILSFHRLSLDISELFWPKEMLHPFLETL